VPLVAGAVVALVLFGSSIEYEHLIWAHARPDGLAGGHAMQRQDCTSHCLSVR